MPKSRSVWPYPASRVERDVAVTLKRLARERRVPVSHLIAESVNRLVREADAGADAGGAGTSPRSDCP